MVPCLDNNSNCYPKMIFKVWYAKFTGHYCWCMVHGALSCMYEPAKFVILGSLWEVTFFAFDFKYFSTRKWELSFSNRYWSTVCWSMSFSRIGYPGISIIFHYKFYWYVFISYDYLHPTIYLFPTICSYAYSVLCSLFISFYFF